MVKNFKENVVHLDCSELIMSMNDFIVRYVTMNQIIVKSSEIKIVNKYEQLVEGYEDLISYPQFLELVPSKYSGSEFDRIEPVLHCNVCNSDIGTTFEDVKEHLLTVHDFNGRIPTYCHYVIGKYDMYDLVELIIGDTFDDFDNLKLYLITSIENMYDFIRMLGRHGYDIIFTLDEWRDLLDGKVLESTIYKYVEKYDKFIQE